MKIKFINHNEIVFSLLTIGEIFEFDKSILMKIENITLQGVTLNSLNLNNHKLENITPTSKVILLNAELHIIN